MYTLPRIFTLVILIICIKPVNSQSILKAQDAILISPTVAMQFPSGEWANTYGYNFTIGVGIGKKFKNNFKVGANFHYIFGDQVKNTHIILAPIINENGFVFNTTGNYAEVNIFERGIYGMLEISQTFTSFLNANVQSGPSISLGAGYLYNWIEFDNLGNDSPQILDEYKKGYDQLRGGFTFKQSIGYTYLATNRRINFRLSFEVLEALTTELRGYNYSTGKTSDKTALNLLYGFRLNWYLPIYQKSGQQFFYN